MTHLLAAPPPLPTLVCTCSTASRSRNGRDCHHGMNVTASQDVLVANISHGMTCYHDLTVFNFTVRMCVGGEEDGEGRGLPPRRWQACYHDLPQSRSSR